ncbi:MAG: hypothetical protein RMK29_21415 [Myxococcales bacterium]|nr:hypothetical protein [Myxococcota bacterium]MDW8284271.1 hypothetical protein [Myxococcales bacterium]
MIPMRQSKSQEPNPHLCEAPRRAGETNRQWLARLVGSAARPPGGQILLLGGTSVTDFRLRVAQSHARHDMTPSLWSHVALMAGPTQAHDPEQDWLLYEVALEPPGGFGAVPRNNGVQLGRLSHYDDPVRYPNIALLCFADLSPETLADAVERFRRERHLVDIAALLVEWLGFVWGAGTQGNPLLREAGVPAAAFVEGVYAQLGIDLTPGSSSRASSPEAIWQAARWWHEVYKMGVTQASVPCGHYCLGQPEAACRSD